MVVQDADRLDAIGAVGVMRCAAFSGAKGRTLLGKSKGEGVDTDTAEQHFHDKLLNVKDRMKVSRASDPRPRPRPRRIRRVVPLHPEVDVLYEY